MYMHGFDTCIHVFRLFRVIVRYYIYIYIYIYPFLDQTLSGISQLMFIIGICRIISIPIPKQCTFIVRSVLYLYAHILPARLPENKQSVKASVVFYTNFSLKLYQP